MNIVIGNIIALIASLIMVYIGILKKKENIILLQTWQIILLILSHIVLGGITGAITNMFSCVRNILCYKNMLKVKEKIIIILLVSILSVYFNNVGFIGLLPLLSTIPYTIFIDMNGVIKFKILHIYTMIIWIIYHLYIKSYTAAIFEMWTIITSVIAIYQLYNEKRVYK